MNLVQFIETFQEAITQAVVQTYPPVYSARDRERLGFDLSKLRRRPLGGQADAIRAVALAIQQYRGTNLVGEMGTGKTSIGAAAAYFAGMQRVLVLCPPHLVRKWQREVLTTVPGASACILGSISDLGRLHLMGGHPQFVILSRERAKLSYRWKPAVAQRLALSGGRLQRNEEGEPISLLSCPACFKAVRDSDGLPMQWEDIERKKRHCEACGNPLWSADRSGPRRFPLADYIGRRMPSYFDLLIVDEQHEYKARGSAQGLAAGALAEACSKVLTLTGTLMGGYASTLFYLLWRFSPALREEFTYHDEQRWVARYGLVERITQKGEDEAYEDGRSSRRKAYRTRVVEKPGVSPAVLMHLIGNTAFLRLSDVSAGLPEYREVVQSIPMDSEETEEGLSQSKLYHRLSGQLIAAVRLALARGSKRLLGAYLQSLLAYPDACTRGETVIDPSTQDVLASVPPLPEDRLYPKEQKLLELVRAERARGRRVLVYVTHTASRDITPRLESVLSRGGLRVTTLKADTVSADQREEWLARRVKQGLDVLLVHPRLVQTGLDLVDFPTIVWFEVEYSVYTMRQASRRSWRIGQRLPVQVIYFAYEGTLQAQALALVAKKLKASLAVEGELDENGLAGHGDQGDDLLLALARSLTNRVESGDESLESLFASAREVEREAEGALQADDFEPWDVPALSEPMTDSAPIGGEDFGDLVGIGGLPLFLPSSLPDRSEDFGKESPVRSARTTHGQQLRLL